MSFYLDPKIKFTLRLTESLRNLGINGQPAYELAKPYSNMENYNNLNVDILAVVILSGNIEFPSYWEDDRWVDYLNFLKSKDRDLKDNPTLRECVISYSDMIKSYKTLYGM